MVFQNMQYMGIKEENKNSNHRHTGRERSRHPTPQWKNDSLELLEITQEITKSKMTKNFIETWQFNIPKQKNMNTNDKKFQI